MKKFTVYFVFSPFRDFVIKYLFPVQPGWDLSYLVKTRPCLYVELPLTEYREAWELQQAIVAAKKEGRLVNDVILVLEHPPVYTLGRRGGIENLCVPRTRLAEEGIDVVQIERGGDITYHGPGQLVAYPLMDIRRARLGVTELVTSLEEIMINTASAFGIQAGRNPLNRGVWVGRAKLGSIGIAVRRDITFHGMALNVNLDMTHFSWINPCGLKEVNMTSLAEAAGKPIDMQAVRRSLQENMQSVLGVELEQTDPETLAGFVHGQTEDRGALSRE
ncbi:MAG: lipoyl(octanoyl) transferase LipB [Thermodesulfobacteriota bacterium]